MAVDPRPLFLHGHDVDPASLRELTEALGAELLPGPLVLGDGPGRAWFEPGEPAGDACVLVRASTGVVGRTLIGYSQGAALAFALACDGDSPPDSVVCVAGFVADDVDPSCFAALRLLVAHSDDDEVVDSFYAGLLARNAVNAGAAVVQVSYDGGHIWTDEITEIVRGWLAGAESATELT